MTSNDVPSFPWNGSDLSAWFRSWQRTWGLAPETLVQPVLPGWSFNINSNNSSAPQTELDVVAKHSYGRQIGRMADALAALVVERHGPHPSDRSLIDFLAMKEEIDLVKQDTAMARLERFKKDLELLREQDPSAYQQLRAALRAAPDD
jgi:hypothetical protein